MSTSSDSLRDLLNHSVAPALKAAGFRRKRNDWARPVGDAIQRIGIQSHSGGNIFTVNVAVEYPAVYAAAGWTRPPTSAGLTFAAQRIGVLMPTRRDRWWSNTSDGAEVTDAIVHYALPWLDVHSDLATWGALLHDGWMKVAVFVVLGDLASVNETIDRMRARVDAATTDAHRQIDQSQVDIALRIVARAESDQGS